jgi:hypothetical protein
LGKDAAARPLRAWFGLQADTRPEPEFFYRFGVRRNLRTLAA